MKVCANHLKGVQVMATTVQLNLNFTHACRHTRVLANLTRVLAHLTRVLAHLTRVKLQKLACVCTVAYNFGVRTWACEHMRHMRNACHELALGLPHYMCGVTTGTVAVGNELQLFCS